MKKKILITVAIAACIALCVAVWPQAKMVEETPLWSKTLAVSGSTADASQARGTGADYDNRGRKGRSS